MRILVFSIHDHLPPTGGAEQAFGHITGRLPHLEFDLICARLSPHAQKFEVCKNVTIHRLGFGIPKLDGLLLALLGHRLALQLHKKQRYDLMWSIMASYGAFSAVRVKKKTGLPFLLTLQEGDPFEYIYRKVRLVRKQFNEIFQIADGIQAISNYLLEWGRAMGFQGKKSVLIPNGVAVDSFTNVFDGTVLTETRRAFGFSEDSLILITSSRLEVKNGIRDVIRALSILPERVCFVVCGSGSLEVELREEVNNRNLSHRVTFLGFVDPEELPRLMKAADIFIRPSLSEGLGNAFLEALAARRIVIGTNAGGIKDFLVDGVTGFLVEREDPESIKQTIERIEKLEASEIERIKDAGETMVRRVYNWDIISRDMEALFCELVRVDRI